MITIKSYKDIKEDGKKVAFIANNRSLTKFNVKNICSTYEALGGNISPIIYCDANKAEGIELIDAITGEKISDTMNCIVIVDGQHRFTAAFKKIVTSSNGSKLLKDALSTDTIVSEDKLLFMECPIDKPLKEILGAVNSSVKPWSAMDYLTGASIDCNDEGIKFVASLAKAGYKANTLSLILYNKADRLKTTDLKRIFTEGRLSDMNDEKLTKAKRFIELARIKFEDTIIRKRYLIQAVIATGKMEALANLSDEDVDTIKKAKDENDVIEVLDKINSEV